VARCEGCITPMAQTVEQTSPSRFSRKHIFSRVIACLAVLVALAFSGLLLRCQDEPSPVDDITAQYHFLTMDDTLAILDEEGRLKGYVEVTQPADESDDILTYDIVDGSRTKNRVEFRTNRIHGKFYRFSGSAERGKGHEEKDADYLHLTGDLEIVTVRAETGKEVVQVVRVTLKSIGKAERPDD
jgi:hypothetical protein